MSKRKAQKELKDFAIVGGPTEDGRGAHLLRVRDGNVMAGEIRPAREGEPITNSELVRLRPIDATNRICEVEVLHSPQDAAASTADEPVQDSAVGEGPKQRKARVATANYRKNWSTIFEAKAKKRSKSDWSLN